MSLCSSVHTGTKRRTLEFPRDIIHDIFSRLPFKSVLRLKCACKSWYFLLKDPDFVIMHLNESMKRKDDNFSFMICNFKHFLVDYDTSSAKLLKAYRELPEAFSKYQSKYFNVVYGFGYESAHDEYKVIRIRDGILLFANCFIGFPANRVIGSGTNLDSSKFRFLIVDQLDVNAQDVQ
ncbi:hypothetical protein IFM89_031762, partial [Coptis chinensis]